jgi:hypothetical protein
MRKKPLSSILFERTRNAYLPEIDAYKKYLAKHYSWIKVYDSRDNSDTQVDIHWRFMGTDVGSSASCKFIVHEYNSLSTNPIGPLKNSVKSFLNRKPDRRIFLSPAVRDGFFFQDNVSVRLRDMGINSRFYLQREKPEYDFIYVGSLDRTSVIVPFLKYFSRHMTGKSLMLVGRAENEMKNNFKDFGNIIFHGPAPYAEIPSFLAKARYGLNLMPDVYPFNRQTSTKMLEYCAANLPVVSSDYAWAQKFAKERGASVFWLKNDFSNLMPTALEVFDFKTPDVRDLEWDVVIRASGVFDFLDNS